MPPLSSSDVRNEVGNLKPRCAPTHSLAYGARIMRRFGFTKRTNHLSLPMYDGLTKGIAPKIPDRPHAAISVILAGYPVPVLPDAFAPR
jgi:hypothetical protein